MAYSSLAWDLSYVSLKKHKTCLPIGNSEKLECILQNCCGSVDKGELLMILGGSGAGKTTFLKILSGQDCHAYNVFGSILYKGNERGADFENCITQVPQEDFFSPTPMTVQEMLRFHAKCQLPSSRYTKEQKNEVADKIAFELSLEACLHSRADDKLSGGEKRRLSLGLALIKSPELAFIDEPTSGLDSTTALHTMRLVREQATKNNRAMVCTIHQPSNDVLALSDKLMILSQSGLVYFGPTSKAADFFARCDMVPPLHINYADYFMDLATIDERSSSRRKESKARVEFLCAKYLEIRDEFAGSFANALEKTDEPSHEELKEIRKGSSSLEALSSSSSPRPTLDKDRKHLGWISEFGLAFLRFGKNALYNKVALAACFGQLFLASLECGLIAFQVQHDQRDVQARLGVMNLILDSFSFIIGVSAGSNMIAELPQIRHEQRNKLFYYSSALFVARMIVEACLACSFVFLCGIVFYFMVGYESTASRFFTFIFGHSLLMLCYHSIFGSLVYWAKDLELVVTLSPLIIFTSLMFGGLLINLDNLWVGISWLRFLAPLHHCAPAMFANVFEGETFTCSNTTQQCLDTGEKVLEALSMEDISVWENFGFLACLTFGFYLLGFYGFYRACHASIDYSTLDPAEAFRDLVRRRKSSLWVDALLRKREATEDRGSSGGLLEDTDPSLPERLTESCTSKSLVFLPQDSSDASGPQFIFEWHNVSYGVKLPNNATLPVLHGVSGQLEGGEMVLLMGASGAGKSSLMNVLSGRLGHDAGTVEGEILFNGAPRRPGFQRETGYVEQVYHGFMLLTVRETLVYTAKLKHIEGEDPEVRAENIAVELGLIRVLDTRVSKISGGEQRRLALGVALVDRPSVLFLDEITSGLDSHTAMETIQTMRGLVNASRGVIATLHQPRPEIFGLFDKVVLLSQGRVCYFGSRDMMEGFFASIGLKTRDYENPAEFYLGVTSIQAEVSDEEERHAAQDRVDMIVHSFSNLEAASAPKRDIPTNSEQRVSRRKVELSHLSQMVVLLGRGFRVLSRDVLYILVTIGGLVLSGLLIGLIGLQPGNGQDALRTKFGTIFYIGMIGFFAGLSTGMSLMWRTMEQYRSEKYGNAYQVLPYFLSMYVVDFCLQRVADTIYVPIPYFLIGFEASSRFGETLLIVYLLSASGHVVGFLLALLTPTLQEALRFVPFVSLPYEIFSGFYVNSERIPSFVSWLRYLSMPYFGYGALATSQFAGQTFDCDQTGDYACLETGEQALNQFGITQRPFGTSVLILSGIVAGLFVIDLVLFKLKYNFKCNFATRLPNAPTTVLAVDQQKTDSQHLPPFATSFFADHRAVPMEEVGPGGPGPIRNGLDGEYLEVMDDHDASFLEPSNASLEKITFMRESHI